MGRDLQVWQNRSQEGNSWAGKLPFQKKKEKKKSLLTNLTTKKDLFSIGNVLMNIFKSQSYTLQLPLCTDHHQKREKKIINNIIQENKPKQAYLHALAQLLTQPAASPLWIPRAPAAAPAQLGWWKLPLVPVPLQQLLSVISSQACEGWKISTQFSP